MSASQLLARSLRAVGAARPCPVLPGTLAMAVLLVMSVGTVALFPLTLASNVFVAPRTMPCSLQAFVTANPVSHLVTAERGLMNGHPPAGQVTWVLLAAAGLVAVFAPLTARLYGRQR